MLSVTRACGFRTSYIFTDCLPKINIFVPKLHPPPKQIWCYSLKTVPRPPELQLCHFPRISFKSPAIKMRPLFLKTAGVKMAAFWDVAPRSLVGLGDVSAVMLGAVSASETSVNLYQTIRRNIPEDSHFS
jgi:hypothetical protein